MTFVHIDHSQLSTVPDPQGVTPPVHHYHTERVVEKVPTLIPHDHPSELPSGGHPGDVLTQAANGITLWAAVPKHNEAYLRIKELEKALKAIQATVEMNNTEKRATIDRLNAYWLDKHPDCFIEMEDGRRVFRQELLDLKHDVLLTEVYNRKPADLPKPKQWPLWLAFAGLFLMEIAHVVIH